MSELAEPFKISQQAVSKHLAYLQRARLIKRQRSGRQNLCAIDPTPFNGITTWIETCRQFWEESFDRLDIVLSEMKEDRNNGPNKRK